MQKDLRKSRLFGMLKQIAQDGEIAKLFEEFQSSSEPEEGGELFGTLNVDSDDLAFAREALASVVSAKGSESLDEEQQESLEAIIHRRYRPALFVEADSFKRPPAPWAHLGDRAELRSRIESVIPFIGAVELVNDPKGRPYVGTAVIVGPGLVLTNRHVAEEFVYGIGRSDLVFKPGILADVDFLQEQGSPKSRRVQVSPKRLLMVHPWWDIAILSVDGLEEYEQYRKPIDEYPRLLTDPEMEQPGREVVVIGYPALDERNDVDLQRKIFQVFNVKRMQPGKLGGRHSYLSYGNTVNAITHDCSTLGGNSGSAVVDVKTGAIIGIHFAGEYLQANYAVPATELAKDGRVVDCGIRFDSRPGATGCCDPVVQTAWDEIERLSGSQVRATARSGVLAFNSEAEPGQMTRSSAGSNQSVPISIPLQISVSVGPATLASTATSSGISTTVLSQEGQVSSSPRAIDTEAFYLGALFSQTFSWKSALSLALACKLAYESEQRVRATCVGSGRSWGFTSSQFIDVDDTQCFVALTPEIALVSFRGTESRGDWLRNVNVPGRTRDYGVVHRGFLGAFQAVESRLRSALAGIAGRKLVLTGHSLGGALATVMAAEWQSFMPASLIVTYGQPAVGSGAFRMFILQHYTGNFFRFVNDDDIVPRVPPGYEHVGRLLHFDAVGSLQSGQSLSVTESPTVESVLAESIEQGPPMLTEAEYQALQGQIGQEVVRVNRPLKQSGEQPQPESFFPSVSDHSLDKYIAKIAARVV